MKWLLMLFMCTYSTLSCSTIVREVFPCNKWKLIMPQLGNVQRVIDLRKCRPMWDVFIKTYHSGFRELCRIILKARGNGWHQENSVFYAILGWCTTQMNFQILCQLVPGLLTFKLDGFPSLRGDVDMNFHPYPSHYCQVTATCKERFYFLQWCLSRGVSRWNKLSSILEDVLSHIIFYGIIVLIFLNFSL